MTKIIGIVDCDSFYASCEKIFRPDWARRPVVVLSNNDGCVVSRSQEAKDLQIPMGEPYFRLKAFADSRGVIVRSANFEFYGDMSRRVIQTLSQWTPSIDVYSIDEAFLDLTSRFHDFQGRFKGLDEDPGGGKSLGDIPRQTRRELELLAEEIVTTVRKWTGVPVSLGLAPTRTLAKAACRLAKDDYVRTGRKYALLFERRERAQALARTPVENVWGVGRRLAKTLTLANVRTALDLARLEPGYMRESFSIVQERLVRELRGEQMYDAEPPEPQRSMQISRTFKENISTLEEIEKPIATFAANVGSKLRARNLVASGLYVYIATNRHNVKAPQRNVGSALNFPRPTNSTPEIMALALKLARKLFAPGFGYKKAGVVALETTEEALANERRYLFEVDPERPREVRERENSLCRTVDRLNRTFGKGTVFFAAEGIDPAWRPNSNFISPCYTTDWASLPVAK